MDVLYSSEIKTGRSAGERGADFATGTKPLPAFMEVLDAWMASELSASEEESLPAEGAAA
jgi:hypothetical protein